MDKLQAAMQLIVLGEEIDGMTVQVTSGDGVGVPGGAGVLVSIYPYDTKHMLFSLRNEDAEQKLVDAITKLSGIIAARQ